MVRPGRFVLCVTFLAAAACSGGGDDPGPTATAAAPSSTAVVAVPSTAPPTPSDPFAIPEVIDAAYVNRVLAALYAIDGDVVREVVRTRTVGKEAIDKTAEIFSGPQLESELENLVGLLAGGPPLKDPPGDRIVTVRSLLISRHDCVVALADSDFSNVVVSPHPTDPSMIGLLTLVQSSAQIRSRGVNPTPWTIFSARLISRSAALNEAAPCS